MNRTLILGTIAALTTAGLVIADDHANHNSPQMNITLPAAIELTEAEATQFEKDFVKAAANENLFEIASAELAEQKSQNEAVRAYAAAVGKAHQANHEKLIAVAEEAGIKVPEKINSRIKRAKLAELEKLEGNLFDIDYMFGQAAGHDMAILLFSHAAEAAPTPAIREYAEMSLPGLRGHDEQAGQIAHAFIGGKQGDSLNRQNRAQTAGGEVGNDIERENDDEDSDVNSSVNPGDMQPTLDDDN